GVEAIDIDPGDVNIGISRDDPIGQYATQTTAGQNADGIQARRYEVTFELRRLPDDGTQIWRKALGTTEQLFHADFRGDRPARHGALEKGRHALPIRRQLAEGEIVRNSCHFP